MNWPAFDEYNPENVKGKRKVRRSDEKTGEKKAEVFRLNKVIWIFEMYRRIVVVHNLWIVSIAHENVYPQLFDPLIIISFINHTVRFTRF